MTETKKMPTPTEKFAALKKQVAAGVFELSLPEFGSVFSLTGDIIKGLKVDLSKAVILSESENKFSMKAFCKDFMIKNHTVNIEAVFTRVNDNLEIFAICKPEKMPDRLSKLPGMAGKLLKPLDFIQINGLVFIITTKETLLIKSKEFPEYNDKKTNLKPGIHLAGFIDLKNSGNVVSLVIKPLKPVIGEGPYFMSWDMKGKADIDFSFDLPKDIDIESLFKIKKPKIVLRPVLPVQVSIDGEFEIALPAVPKVAVPGGFSFTADGIRGKFNLDNIADKIPAPFGYPGVHLSTLTVTAGISNGVPLAGAEGNFFIGPAKPADLSNKQPVNDFGGLRSNQYKFIYDIIPGKVIPKFAYLYLEKLTITEYIKALTNQNISLPAFFNSISIEQAMFHWCETPQGETKPDGTMALPVFGLSGITNIFGHRTFTEFIADAAGASKGKLIADPINIGNGLLVIAGNGKGTPAKYKGGTKVKPGGMELMFSSNGKPAFFSFSAKIRVLGLSGEGEGSLGEKGITASIKSDIAGIIRDQLELVFKENAFKVRTVIDAKISGLKISLGKLGTLKLNTALQGDFSAAFENNNYSNSMRLRFEYFGIVFDLGTLSVSIKDLKNIVKELEEFIRKEILQKLTADVLKWLNAAIDGAIEFTGEKLAEIGKALKEVYKESLENAAKLMKKVGYKAKEVGEALTKGFKATEQELANAMKKAKFLAEEAGEVLKKVVKITGDAAAQVLKKAGYTAEEVGRTLKTVYGLGEKSIGQILKNMGATADQVAKILRDSFQLNVVQVGNVLKLLGYPADIASTALKGIGGTVENVNKVLVDVYKVQAEAARNVLQQVGFPIKEITKIIPHIKVPLPNIHIKVPSHLKAPHIKAPHIKF